MKIIRNDSYQNEYSSAARKLILNAGLSQEQAQNFLCLNETDYSRWWKECDINLKASNLDSLTKALGISSDEAVFETYDLTKLRKDLFRTAGPLPDRYSVNSYSRVRSSSHIIKYLTLTKGQMFADQILKSMQVSPLLFDDQDNRISLNFFLDLLETLSDWGFSPGELDNLACVLFLGLQNTNLGNRFKSAQTHAQCYAILGESLSSFDENFLYSYDVDSSQFHMTSILPFDKHESTALSPRRLALLQRYRLILLGWFPYLSGLEPILPSVQYSTKKSGLCAQYSVYFAGDKSRPLTLCRN